MMTVLLRVWPVLMFASLLPIACEGGSSKTSSKVVLIDQFKYQPDTLSVRVGDTVEWKNIDIVPHTATVVDAKSFDSGPIAKGGSWRFTFRRKGTYDYLCTFHPNMKGKLIVQEESSGSGSDR